jgi:hypothetical protein
MFCDNLSDSPESGARLRVMLAEIWHAWLEAISVVAYQTHRACEVLSENSDPLNMRHGPFDPCWRSQTEGANSSIDIRKLEECLQSMNAMQAARVIHAVQMMQAMEAILQRRRSRATKEEAAW